MNFDSNPASDASFDFESGVLGAGLPAEAQALIEAAGQCRSEPDRAEPLLLRAQALAPEHPATLIALYRFYFYGHRLELAREVATLALKVGRAALGGVWQAPFTDEQARFDAAVRFYLFSLKGYAYLCLRLGDLAEGQQALSILRQMDPQDRVGGGVLAQVLAKAEAGESGDEEATSVPPQPMGHRGWGTP